MCVYYLPISLRCLLLLFIIGEREFSLSLFGFDQNDVHFHRMFFVVVVVDHDRLVFLFLVSRNRERFLDPKIVFEWCFTHWDWSKAKKKLSQFDPSGFDDHDFCCLLSNNDWWLVKDVFFIHVLVYYLWGWWLERGAGW